MSEEVLIRSRPIVDFDDKYLSANIPVNAGNGTIAPGTVLSFNTRTGKQAFLTKLGNAVQAGGESSITFRVLVNGARLHPYDGSQNQWGDPSLLQGLPVRIALPQNALIKIECDNSDTANIWTATARVFVEYEDFEDA